MASQKLINKLKRIAKEHDVVVRFHKAPKPYGGFYNMDKKSIVVVLYPTERTSPEFTQIRRYHEDLTISSFLHELAHVLDHRDSIYLNYYNKGRSLRKMRYVALKAERHTDERASKLCKTYFKGQVKYVFSYKDKWGTDYLKKYYSSWKE